MKCKNWSNKINNFVVRKLKSFKINGQQQALSTMPAMPKEKTSPVPLNESNFTEMKMKEQLDSSTSKLIATKAAEGILSGTTAKSLDLNLTLDTNTTPNGTANLIKSINDSNSTNNTSAEQNYQTNNKINYTTTSTTTTDCSSDPSNNCILVNENEEKSPSHSELTNGVTSAADGKQNTTSGAAGKKSATDYVFGKYIGEGSFSTVYLAKDIHTNKEYAIKVCDKQHILREKKQEYVRREREVMHIMNNVPGFVHLSCTFQDYRNLYFVMTYAKNSDLLPYINKVGSFDLDCTRHYAAELVLAMEQMHKRGIVHRDLKPENILLDESMHSLIADFGSAKILFPEKPPDKKKKDEAEAEEAQARRRKGSFVGTAQYVSPEVLQGNIVTRSADLWAFGCIIYQMISGLPPFRGGSDYLIFKEIMNLNLVFPEGFDENAQDLVKNLLKLHPEERMGAQDKLGRYESIRTHPFFEGINWDTVRQQTPPPIYPYLPGTNKDEELRSHYRVPDNLEPGLDDRQLTRLLGLELGTASGLQLEKKTETTKNKFDLSESERQRLLEAQRSDKWAAFADGEVILKKGLVNKRKGLFARRRMLLLTTGPRLIYIDPVQMIKKGEIPWSCELRVEPKNFKIFFVHTPNRTYYLEDPEGYALEWVNAIEDVRQKTYGNKS